MHGEWRGEEEKNKEGVGVFSFDLLVIWSFGRLVTYYLFFVAEGYIEEGSQPIES